MKDAAGKVDVAVLTCWKDIANYLGKGVRTVQRWEQELGLPVRRPNGIVHKSSVIAYARDLDAWLDLNWSEKDGKHFDHEANEHQRRFVQERSRLNELIETSREIRSVHSALIQQTTVALAALVNSCRQLERTRYNWHGKEPCNDPQS